MTVDAILRHAEALHSQVPLRTFDGQVVRSVRYGEVARRVRRLAQGLRDRGITAGDRVATFMWNTQAHVEAYFAVPCIGAVLHTLNVRLTPSDVSGIMDDAEDLVLLVDDSLWTTVEPLLGDRPSIRLVAIAGPDSERLVAQASAAGPLSYELVAYEDLLAAEPASDLAVTDETAAASMCYTSGTTGRPKGVVYSHRSIYLHSMANCMTSGFGLGERDRLLAVVPMFHANGWGFPYAAWLSGASLILPGRHVQPELLTPLVAQERPTVSGGVPTVWRGVLDHAQEHGLDITSLRVISCAGSAVPSSLLKAYGELGIEMVQAWGMTETSPLAAIARAPAWVPEEDDWRWRTATGRPVPGVEMRVVGEADAVLPRDGSSVGEFEVRGPWVTGAYYGGRDADRFHDGWLRTGDLGTLDRHGAMRITDRAKDVIKSGGEWISSTELEDAILLHPAVVDAAVIGVPDDRWQERPLAIYVLRQGADVGPEELRDHLSAHVARWQLPDHWLRASDIPRTGVGKIDKQRLRAEHAGGAAGP